MIKYRKQVFLLQNMAKQVDDLTDGFASLNNFHSDVSNTLKNLVNNQNAVNQSRK